MRMFLNLLLNVNLNNIFLLKNSVGLKFIIIFNILKTFVLTHILRYYKVGFQCVKS